MAATSTPPVAGFDPMKGDPLLKLVVVGDRGSGKTSLIQRWCQPSVRPTTQSTIGVEFYFNKVVVSERTVYVQIWDTAGEPRYRIPLHNYYAHAHGVLVVADATGGAAAFRGAHSWFREMETFLQGRSVVKVLVINKSDIATEPQKEQLKALASSVGAECVTTSATAAIPLNVNDAFLRAIRLPRYLLPAPPAPAPASAAAIDRRASRTVSTGPAAAAEQPPAPQGLLAQFGFGDKMKKLKEIRDKALESGKRFFEGSDGTPDGPEPGPALDNSASSDATRERRRKPRASPPEPEQDPAPAPAEPRAADPGRAEPSEEAPPPVKKKPVKKKPTGKTSKAPVGEGEDEDCVIQ